MSRQASDSKREQFQKLSPFEQFMGSPERFLGFLWPIGIEGEKVSLLKLEKFKLDEESKQKALQQRQDDIKKLANPLQGLDYTKRRFPISKTNKEIDKDKKSADLKSSVEDIKSAIKDGNLETLAQQLGPSRTAVQIDKIHALQKSRSDLLMEHLKVVLFALYIDIMKAAYNKFLGKGSREGFTLTAVEQLADAHKLEKLEITSDHPAYSYIDSLLLSEAERLAMTDQVTKKFNSLVANFPKRFNDAVTQGEKYLEYIEHHWTLLFHSVATCQSLSQQLLQQQTNNDHLSIIGSFSKITEPKNTLASPSNSSDRVVELGFTTQTKNEDDLINTSMEKARKSGIPFLKLSNPEVTDLFNPFDEALLALTDAIITIKIAKAGIKEIVTKLEFSEHHKNQPCNPQLAIITYLAACGAKPSRQQLRSMVETLREPKDNGLQIGEDNIQRLGWKIFAIILNSLDCFIPYQIYTYKALSKLCDEYATRKKPPSTNRFDRFLKLMVMIVDLPYELNPQQIQSLINELRKVAQHAEASTYSFSLFGRKVKTSKMADIIHQADRRVSFGDFGNVDKATAKTTSESAADNKQSQTFSR